MGQLVMVIKTIFLALLICGCGREVKLNNKLESISELSEADKSKNEKTGVLYRDSSDKVKYKDKDYKVSIYSSKSASDFIQAIPTGSQVPVVFVGEVRGSDIVLASIKRQ
jgi:hypothetical protein